MMNFFLVRNVFGALFWYGVLWGDGRVVSVEGKQKKTSSDVDLHG
jgi:hypothetical protein